MTAGVTDQSLYELFETIPPAAPGKDPELGTRLDKDTLSLFDSYCKLTGDSLVRHLLNIVSSPLSSLRTKSNICTMCSGRAPGKFNSTRALASGALSNPRSQGHRPTKRFSSGSDAVIEY